MDEEELYQAIFKRKSVRRYDPTPMDANEIHKIETILKNLDPIWTDINTDVKIISPQDVKNRMMRKSPHYLAIFSENKEGYLTNVGFMLQKMDLYFSSRGIGSCWQGIPQIKQNIKDSTNLEFVILMPFGTPSEPLHRDISQFKRKSLSEITNLKNGEELLEPVRIAPSSTNSQPWYFTGDKTYIHAYCNKPNPIKAFFVKKFNQIDMGIALYHLHLAAYHQGKNTKILMDNEAANLQPPGYIYTASVKIM
jgi:nitroreductase